MSTLNSNSSFYESNQGLSTFDYGIVIKTEAELLIQAQNIMIATFGANVNLDASTPNGFLVQQITNALIDKQNEMLTCYNNLNPELASGQFLDSICAFNQIYRKLPTQSYATLLLTGLNGTIIPQNSQVLNENGDIFYTKYELIIGSNGTVLGVFYSELYGEISIQSINRIYDTISGWDTVNNTDPVLGKVGTVVESDYLLRIRRKNSVSISGSGSFPSILSSIYNIDGVNNIQLFQNILDTEQTIPNMPDGFLLKPKSLFAVINYDDLIGIEDNIANVFYVKKSGGCGLQNYGTGAKTKDVIINNAPEDIVFISKWNKSEDIEISVKITLNQKYKDEGKYPASRTQTLEEIVKDIIYNNFKYGVNVLIGETIYTSLFVEILSENGISYIMKVETKYSTNVDFQNDGLSFKYTQIAHISKENITVVFA